MRLVPIQSLKSIVPEEHFKRNVSCNQIIYKKKKIEIHVFSCKSYSVANLISFSCVIVIL